jgi:hypothetical protein
MRAQRRRARGRAPRCVPLAIQSQTLNSRIAHPPRTLGGSTAMEKRMKGSRVHKRRRCLPVAGGNRMGNPKGMDADGGLVGGTLGGNGVETEHAGTSSWRVVAAMLLGVGGGARWSGVESRVQRKSGAAPSNIQSLARASSARVKAKARLGGFLQKGCLDLVSFTREARRRWK